MGMQNLGEKYMSPFEPKPSLPLNTALPFDQDVVHGTLSNGFRYYIRRNIRPKERAEIRFVVDAGSILEDDDQCGLAHILEHMAFNGSTNFGARELVKFFESIGSRFGAHLNAQTGFDNTIYKLHIPTDNEEIIDKSLLVVQDWAQALLFLPEEIERERLVGLEEWRQRRGARTRLLEKLSPMLFYKSKYVQRLPIGTEESLKSFTHDALKRFYHDWYRPELMSIVVVGDVDVDAIEEKIQASFSSLRNPKQVRERQDEKIRSHTEAFSLVMQDNEVPHRAFCILSKRNKKESINHSDFLDDLVCDLAFRAANERLSFLGQAQNAPFLGAKIGRDDLNRSTSTDVFHASLPVENIKECIERCCTEILRFQQYGITQAELNRAKKVHISSVQAAYQERETTHSRILCSEIVRHITEREALVGLDFDYEFTMAHIQEITCEQVNECLSNWLLKNNRVQYLITPDEEHPTSEQMQSWIEQVQLDPAAAPEEEEESKPLLYHFPKPGNVKQKRKIPELDMEEWILSNGARVLLKQTTFQADRILFSSYCAGGRSIIATEDFYSSKMATSCVRRSGLGQHSLIELQKILSGATVQVVPYIKSTSHGFQGVSTVNHLETLFQLQYLFATKPRLEDETFLREMEVAHAHFHNRLADPQVQMHDAFQKLYWDDHPRKQPWTAELLDLVSKDVCKEQFETFFGTAGSEYIIVGNIDFEQIEEYLSLYVASLPSPKEYSIGNWELRSKKDPVCSYIYAGKEPSATYHMSCFLEGAFDRIARIHNGVLSSYIQVMLRRKLREEMGAVYSVQVHSRSLLYPEKGCHFSIDFSCDPERVEEIRQVLHNILRTLPENEPAQEDIDNVLEQLSSQYEVSILENAGWLQYLTSSLQRGEDIKSFIDTPSILKEVTLQSLQPYWSRIYNVERMVELIMLPEEE